MTAPFWPRGVPFPDDLAVIPTGCQVCLVAVSKVAASCGTGCGHYHCSKCAQRIDTPPPPYVLPAPFGTLSAQHQHYVCRSCWVDLVDMTWKWLGYPGVPDSFRETT